MSTATFWNFWLAAGAPPEAFSGGKDGHSGLAAAANGAGKSQEPALTQMSEPRRGFGEDF